MSRAKKLQKAHKSQGWTKTSIKFIRKSIKQSKRGDRKYTKNKK